MSSTAPGLTASLMSISPMRPSLPLLADPDQPPAPSGVVGGPGDGAVTGGGPVASTDERSIFTALRDDLGLALESTRGPLKVFVIDRVERPSEK
jgi:uncharacterized protein (TIGR03435 family)